MRNQGKKIKFAPMQQEETQGQTVDVEKEQYEQLIQSLVTDWATTTFFDRSFPGDLVELALCSFSEREISMPFKMYKSISERHKVSPPLHGINFTISETNALFVIFTRCTPKDLGLTSAEYISFRESIDEAGIEFNKLVNDTNERIRKENPYIQTVGEA